ncbi:MULTISPECIES: hypothetical protein [unclassified Leptospira]|uniref:hypothetical protein n=1 Tax=unclassified Leptospira TaxID=2633828 RepID=UPI0002BD3B92|nr:MULTISPECIES: hypothetical protein [unclassified Leptospira]EMJ98762.1 hypothetical protein LEP1GSC192_3648 [Leptospira sp. B5-022]MCR1795850.1 hypothetical protein [Leptospira sp. id769339]
MHNGNNAWNVSFSVISWLERALKTHKNVKEVSRFDDVMFRVVRKNQNDEILIFCADEYACGITFVHKVLDAYPNCNCISAGGAWNGYTRKAKEYCDSNNIGLFVSEELLGALWKDEYWKHYKTDEEGNRESFYRTEKAR